MCLVCFANIATRLPCLVLLMLAAGCQSARVEQPLTQGLDGEDPGSQMEFWHALQERPITCNDEAFHGLLLAVAGTDPHPDYASRVTALMAQGMLPAGFDAPADAAVRRGDLAVAIVRLARVHGGLMMRVAPRSPRYAVRELMYANVLPPSSPNQTLSGAEFVGIIGRLNDWQAADPARLPSPSMVNALVRNRD